MELTAGWNWAKESWLPGCSPTSSPTLCPRRSPPSRRDRLPAVMTKPSEAAGVLRTDKLNPVGLNPSGLNPIGCMCYRGIHGFA